MHFDLYHLIYLCSSMLGMIGITIILIGAARGLYHYLQNIRQTDFPRIRYEIGSHLILGLDFLVGQDVIQTLLLDRSDPDRFWMDLAGLITVVSVRIVLTYFIQKELEEIKHKELQN